MSKAKRKGESVPMVSFVALADDSRETEEETPETSDASGRRRSAPNLEGKPSVPMNTAVPLDKKTYPSPPAPSNSMECHICNCTLGIRRFKVGFPFFVSHSTNVLNLTQHTCRNCGKSVCGNHSKNNVPLPYVYSLNGKIPSNSLNLGALGLSRKFEYVMHVCENSFASEQATGLLGQLKAKAVNLLA